MKTKTLLGIAVTGTVLLLGFSPVFGGPTGKIVFTTADNKLYVMDAKSGAHEQVPLSLSPSSPAWSPDGQWIVLSGGPGLNSQIYVVKPDGSGFRMVTAGSGDLVSPTFSPDGSKIAYQPVYGNLRTINFDGTGETSYPIYGGFPDWDSGGSRVAVSNWGQGSPPYQSNISIYNFTTGTATQITHALAGEAFTYSSWSPDGSRLAVSKRGTDGDWDVWTMKADGSDPLNLTSDWSASGEGHPSWSPDGQWIVFGSDHSGNSDIWAMRTDGTDRLNLTNTPDINEYSPDIIPEPATLSLLVLGVTISREYYVWVYYCPQCEREKLEGRKLNCPRCGAQYFESKSYVYCPECGFSLRQNQKKDLKQIPKEISPCDCGYKWQASEKFCPYCGKRRGSF